MSCRCGLVGLPNVGKSTIFNALTAGKAEVAGYPFTTINPNAGIVPVPDSRLETLGHLLKPPKLTPTTMEFVDIAGLIQGASQGEGLGNQFLAHIRDVDLLVHVVRGFEAEDIPHIAPNLDPVRDIEIIDTELLLADLEIIRRQLLKTEKAGKSGDKKTLAQLQVLKRLEAFVNQGRWAGQFPWTEVERTLLAEVPLLTRKPYLLVANVSEDEWRGRRFLPALETLALARQVPLIPILGDLEAELQESAPGRTAGVPGRGRDASIRPDPSDPGQLSTPGPDYLLYHRRPRSPGLDRARRHPGGPLRRSDPFGYGKRLYQGRGYGQRRSGPPGRGGQGQRGRSDAPGRQGLCGPGWGNSAVPFSAQINPRSGVSWRRAKIVFAGPVRFFPAQFLPLLPGPVDAGV